MTGFDNAWRCEHDNNLSCPAGGCVGMCARERNAKGRANFATHKRVVLVGEGELNYCNDCKGGEVDLLEQSCQERQAAAARPTVHVLDHGVVRLIDYMGSDLSIIRAARVSYDASWRAGENDFNDARLMRRLWSGGAPELPKSPAHSTPFEAVTVTFEVKAPIFVFRQWHRHRTQSYNELSARYKELPEEFYIPDPAQVGVQSTSSKQGRQYNDELTDKRRGELTLVRIHCEEAFERYRQLLQSGWPRELARMVLPFNTYSHMFCTMNLLNFYRFATLRVDPHAQYEIRVYAEAMLTMLDSVVPVANALFREANGV